MIAFSRYAFTLTTPQEPVAGEPTLQDAASVLQTEESFLFLNLPAPWIVGLLIVPAIIAFAWWSYGGITRLERPTRIALSMLRGLAIALALMLAFQPALERVRYTKVQTQVHVLVDDSASMQRRDAYPDGPQRAALQEASGLDDIAATTRAQLVQRVLTREGGLLEALDDDYEVRLFRFERKPLPISSLDELTSRGPRTQIGDALDLHLATAGSVNLEAVVLVSDGRNNAGLDPATVAAKYELTETPIFSVGIGDPSPPRNIRLIGPYGPQEALRQEEVLFEVTLDAEGLEGRDVVVTLYGALDGGSPQALATEGAILGEDHEPVKVRMFHAFQESGDWVLDFSVTTLSEETSHEDNSVKRFLRVNDEKIRVLYIDEFPRWDYRYLKNALRRVDASIELQAYLFSASGTFEQESSEGLPPLESLPRSRDELFRYHVVLIGDVPPERIAATEEQVTAWLDLLVEFVEFGGGVGMIYGESAMPERYRGTPLEDLLPVALESAVTVRDLKTQLTGGFVAHLANPAVPHDITRLERDPENNRLLWHERLHPLLVYYPVKQLKPGATALLEHPEAETRFGKRVIAATSYFPRGNTFFLATDESWRWRWLYGELYHDKFWRNVVRHLASGRLQRRDDRVTLRVNKTTIDTGSQVRVYLEMLDEEFAPATFGEATVFLRSTDAEPEKRVLRAELAELGRYSGSFTLDDPGSYSFLVYQDDNPAGEVLAREDVFVQIPDREQADSSQDVAALERISEASGERGRYTFLADAAELAEELGGQRPFEHEVDRSLRPMWDSLWTLLALLGVLAVEWIWRKRARLV